MKSIRYGFAVIALVIVLGPGAAAAAFPMRFERIGSYPVLEARDFVVVSNLCYVADYYQGLLILDVHDPRNPALVGSYHAPFYPVAIEVASNRVYLAEYPSFVEVVDVSDPAHPQFAASFTLPNFLVDSFSPLNTFLDSGVLYVANFGGGLDILDVASVQPSAIATYNSLGAAYSIDVVSNLAYLVDAERLTILDVTQPSNVVQIGEFPNLDYWRNGIAKPPYLYVSRDDPQVNVNGGLQVVDVSQPTNPVLRGFYRVAGAYEAMDVDSNFVYMGDLFMGLHAFDVADPDKPILRGSFATYSTPFAVKVVSSRLFVGDSGFLEILDMFRRSVDLDFDADAMPDLAVYHPQSGTWYISPSSGGFTSLVVGTGNSIPVPGDYDGDFRADVAAFEPSSAQWTILASSGGTRVQHLGGARSIPVPADYDGDGITDMAVFDKRSSQWSVQQSRAGLMMTNFGRSASVPVPADYDGDGRADLATFQKSSGLWSILRSSKGTFGMAFGYRATIPVPADYNGDGAADLAVYEPSSGNWYMMPIGGELSIVNFGWSGAIPVPADYDNDGRADPAVYDRATGNWYILASSAGFSVRNFGWDGAVPVHMPAGVL